MKPAYLAELLVLLAEDDSIQWHEIAQLLPTLFENTEFDDATD